MVDNTINTITKLTPEQKQRLEALEKDIEGVEIAADTLKEIGFGIDAIMEKVSWAKNVRKLLLDRFS